jgi:hypothetical protein
VLTSQVSVQARPPIVPLTEFTAVREALQKFDIAGRVAADAAAQSDRDASEGPSAGAGGDGPARPRSHARSRASRASRASRSPTRSLADREPSSPSSVCSVRLPSSLGDDVDPSAGRPPPPPLSPSSCGTAVVSQSPSLPQVSVDAPVPCVPPARERVRSASSSVSALSVLSSLATHDCAASTSSSASSPVAPPAQSRDRRPSPIITPASIAEASASVLPSSADAAGSSSLVSDPLSRPPYSVSDKPSDGVASVGGLGGALARPGLEGRGIFSLAAAAPACQSPVRSKVHRESLPGHLEWTGPSSAPAGPGGRPVTSDEVRGTLCLGCGAALSDVSRRVVLRC